MEVVTRFNPSCNGGLHLGHAYNILVNEHFAHSQGGKFYVRFEDLAVPDESTRIQDRSLIARIRNEQRRDIEWLGVKVDGWYSDDELRGHAEEIWRKRGFQQPGYFVERLPWFVSQPRSWLPISYQPWFTAIRVCIDDYLGCTHLIRGEDLAVDSNLHWWFCDLFELRRPTFIYLPRMSDANGDISKTMGGNKICELRSAGVTPEEVRGILARSCLSIPFFGWDLENIKSRPVLVR